MRDLFHELISCGFKPGIAKELMQRHRELHKKLFAAPIWRVARELCIAEKTLLGLSWEDDLTMYLRSEERHARPIACKRAPELPCECGGYY